MKPLVSVVVAAYNAAQYLHQNIGSLLRQTYEAVEFVYIDDGSVDETADILDKYAEQNLSIKVFHQANKGAGIARNAGLEQAKGKYIFFLDADDFFDKKLIETVVDEAEKTQADMVIYRTYSYDHITGRISNTIGDIHEEYIPQMEIFSVKDVPDTIFQITDTYVWNKMYRREFIEENKIRFQDVRIIDDLFFNMQTLVKAKAISICYERLLYYRINNSNSQIHSVTTMPYNFYYAFKETKKWLISEKLWDLVKKSFVTSAIADCMVELDRMLDGKVYVLLYERIQTEIFRELGIEGNEEWIDNKYLRKAYHDIHSMSAAEFLFEKYKKDPRMVLEQYFNGEKKTYPVEMLNGKKVVLYGAGANGRRLYSTLLYDDSCIIAGWADKNYLELKNRGLPVGRIEDFLASDFDCIVITIAADVIVLKVIQAMVQNGIEKDKIYQLRLI